MVKFTDREILFLRVITTFCPLEGAFDFENNTDHTFKEQYFGLSKDEATELNEILSKKFAIEMKSRKMELKKP